LGEIEAIQRVVNSRLVAEPYAHLIKGEPVTMSEGPLKGLTGTLIEVRKGLRLVVSIELLRRSVLVEIDRSWVVPCTFSMQPQVESLVHASFRTA
jgi:transcription antitermination factor NusG